MLKTIQYFGPLVELSVATVDEGSSESILQLVVFGLGWVIAVAWNRNWSISTNMAKKSNSFTRNLLPCDPID